MWAGIAFLSGVSAPAMATDISFSFSDGPTLDFYGRTHTAGTVTGVIRGLADNATSLPTAIQFISSPDAMVFAEGTYSFYLTRGTGFTLSGGVVTAANFLGNFVDSAGNAMQTRFNWNCVATADCAGDQNNLNLLFWNGGNNPATGTGNQLGFAGVVYSPATVDAAVPEPATWAMMLLGFGAIGFAMRRRKQQPKVPLAF